MSCDLHILSLSQYICNILATPTSRHIEYPLFVTMVTMGSKNICWNNNLLFFGDKSDRLNRFSVALSSAHNVVETALQGGMPLEEENLPEGQF